MITEGAKFLMGCKGCLQSVGVWFVLLRLVGGAGDLKLTKDGNTLLKEMVWLYLLQKHSIDILMIFVLGAVFL